MGGVGRIAIDLRRLDSTRLGWHRMATASGRNLAVGGDSAEPAGACHCLLRLLRVTNGGSRKPAKARRKRGNFTAGEHRPGRRVRQAKTRARNPTIVGWKINAEAASNVRRMERFDIESNRLVPFHAGPHSRQSSTFNNNSLHSLWKELSVFAVSMLCICSTNGARIFVV